MKSHVLTRLARICFRQTGSLAIASVSLIAVAVAQLSVTWLFKDWVETMNERHEASIDFGLLFSAVALVTLLGGAVYSSRYFLAVANQALLHELRATLQRSVLRAGPAAVRRYLSGDIQARLVGDIEVASRFAEEMLRRVVGDGAVLVGAIIMLLVIDWRLAGSLVLLAPVAAALLSRLGLQVRRRSATAAAEMGQLNALLGEQIAGLETIKSYRAEPTEIGRFQRRNDRYRRSALSVDAASASVLALLWAGTGVAVISFITYGSFRIVRGELTTGTLFVFCLYGAQLFEPIRRLGELHSWTQRLIASGERVFGFIDSLVEERTGGTPLPESTAGRIELSDVWFSYTPDQPVLCGITTTIAAGERVAIVGPTGAGKSTLARLLVGFEQPERGSIRIDGVDLSVVSLASLRRSLRYVEQEPFLFAGTIAENLAFGDASIGRDRMKAALEVACLDAWIAELPRGLDTDLSELGNNISGGQKQRLALARAILTEPAILVLDEASSALDGATDELVFQRLDAWLGVRTCLVVSHRLSTILRMPRVIVLGGGCVVEDGSPHTLRAGDTTFARLLGDQLRG